MCVCVCVCLCLCVAFPRCGFIRSLFGNDTLTCAAGLGRQVHFNDTGKRGSTPVRSQVAAHHGCSCADCVFSHVAGSRAPVLLFDRSSAVLHGAAFRHCRIAEELVDVSFASAVRWRSVTLTNTTAAGGAAAADGLVGTPYFDYVSYTTGADGAVLPESEDPATAVGGDGSAVISAAGDGEIGDVDYVVEYGIFDDDMPFWEPLRENVAGDGEPAAIAESSGYMRRQRGWAADEANAGLPGARRLAELRELAAAAFLTPRDAWFVQLKQVRPCSARCLSRRRVRQSVHVLMHVTVEPLFEPAFNPEEQPLQQANHVRTSYRKSQCGRGTGQLVVRAPHIPVRGDLRGA